MSGQLHTLATLPQGKETLVPNQQEATLVPQLDWIFGEEKNMLPLAGN